MKNKILILGVIICVGFLHVEGWAQQFKWVQGGGTAYDLSSMGSIHYERVAYMCTDPNGNIYSLSQVGDDPVVADTFHQNPYGGVNNILLTSYNCSGQMRWAKLIASSGGDCISYGIAADSLGHIYVAGYLTNGTLHIGYDTAISGLVYEDEGLIQLDTSGHFHWVRYVGGNTIASLVGSYSFGSTLTVDASNNAHFFLYTKHGVAITPTDISIGGTYDLVYDPTGNFLSHVRLDLDSEWFLRGVVIDPATNKLYAYGEINQGIYGGFLTDTFFAAAFDASRNKIWQYYAGYGDDNGFTGIALDQSKQLYFSGQAAPHIGETRFVFNGDSVLAPYDVLSIVMKTDTNGSVKWIRSNGCHTSVNGFVGLTLLPNKQIACVGTIAGTLFYGRDTSTSYYDLDSLDIRAGDGWDAYLAIYDTAGYLQTVQDIYGDGFNDEGTAITSDRVGNVYVGGEVVDSVWAGTLSTSPYISIGGNTDFFVMKYGVDCSCTSMPIASYSDTGTHTIGFTYTSIISGIDSVVWNFGDGSVTTSMTTPIHTYTASGTYTACVTVYSECGNDMHCADITVSICSVTPTASFSDTGTHTIGFTYTGTTTGLDSVVWNYGDGTRGTGITPLHTYTASGTYTVCVTAYTDCGSDSACRNVVVSPTGIATLSLANVQLYPNPVSAELHIVGVPAGASYRLLNVTGVVVQHGVFEKGRNSILMKGFTAGVYILEMTGADGARNMVRVVKE